MLVGETRRVEFDFGPGLAEGETVDSQELEVRVFSGTDDNPSALLSGSATENGGIVTQRLAPLVEGVTYEVKCLATTSEDQVLALVGKLAVPPATDIEAEDQVSGGEVVASYDSGILTNDLSNAVLLTAGQTANGGLFQVNLYSAIVTPSLTPMVLEGFITFTEANTNTIVDRTTLREVTTNIAADNISDVEVVNPAPGTQVLVSYTLFGLYNAVEFRVQAEIIRL